MPVVKFNKDKKPLCCTCNEEYKLIETRKPASEYDVYTYTYACKNKHQTLSKSEIKREDLYPKL
jgi:hypothetical protein